MTKAGSDGVHMMDVGGKAETVREAVARGVVRMQESTLAQLKGGKLAKGDVLSAAQLAGIMAAKKTHDLIPLCHPLLLNQIGVEFSLGGAEVEITAHVSCSGRTGVEMESLTAVAVAALTIYDMCKAVDPAIRIDNIRLVRKSGGKSGVVVLE